MKMDLSPKQADLVLDLLYNRAYELNKTLKSLKVVGWKEWVDYKDTEVELSELSKLQSALIELHSK